MSDPTTTQYPDILGYITGGPRAALGPVQAALTVRPVVARVGSSVEVLLLLQNTADAPVRINATLQPPPGCASSQPELSITLFPAEVGYITLPMTASEATPAEQVVGVDVQIIPQAAYRVVRVSDPAHADYYDFFHASSVTPLRSLQSLEFSATTCPANNATRLEAPFFVVDAVTTARPAEVSAGWTSLWTLDDLSGDRAQIQRYGEVILERFLPVLTEERLLDPLRRITEERIKLAGYNIQPVEVDYIARLQVAVLSLAVMPAGDQPSLYHVGYSLRQAAHTASTLIALPNWCRGLLELLETDAHTAEQPIYTLTTLLYDDLLRDAMALGFDRIRSFTGAALGSEDDEHVYGEHVLNILSRADSQPTFTDIYLPLVLGGIIVDRQAALSQRAQQQRLSEIDARVQQRWMERTAENEPIFAMITDTISQLSVSAGQV